MKRKRRDTKSVLKHSLLFLLLAMLSMTSYAKTDCSVVTEIPVLECQTLVTLYVNTQGDTWTDSTTNNWNKNNTPCNWTGVTCSNGHVVQITRQNKNLASSLPDLSSLTELDAVYFDDNKLTGTLTDLSKLPKLINLSISKNQLTGQLPIFSTTLEMLDVSFNQLDGKISNLNLPNLKTLYLHNNQFSGRFLDLNQMPQLSNLNIASNKVIDEMANISTTISAAGSTINVNYNGLVAKEATVKTLLDSKNPNWQKTQTIPPKNINATEIAATSMKINWKPILYTQDNGYYKINYGTTSGSYTQTVKTINKLANNIVLTGLSPNTTYYISVQTHTPKHANQQNEIMSSFSPEIKIKTLATSTNTAPIFNSIADKTVIVGDTVTFAVSATDAENDALQYSFSTLPEGATFDAITGKFNWVTTSVGTYAMTIIVTEVNGQPTSLSNNTNVTITVKAASDSTSTDPTSSNNIGIPPTPPTGDVNGSTNNKGQIATDVHVKPNSSISGGHLNGDIVNEGLTANVIIDENATMKGGGKLTGYSINKGDIDDIVIPPHSQITNEGTMKNVTIGEEANIEGGTLGERVTNAGRLCGVHFAPNAQVVGGRLDCDIEGDEEKPAQVGAAVLAEGLELCYVRLSPTVQFEHGVTLCDNVRLPEDPTYPILEDFGIDVEEIDNFTPKRIKQLEPAAFSVFSAEDTARLPVESFSAINQQQLSQFTAEGLNGLTVAQFEQLSEETLNGFTKDNLEGVPADVIQHFTEDDVEAIGGNTFMNTPALAKLCTNMDPNKISILEVQEWLPSDWMINLETGDITPATGSKLAYKALETKTSDRVTLPNYQPDFNTGMGFGGKTSKNTVLQDLNNTLNTAEIEASFEQKENGVLEVVGQGELAGYTFTFIPDIDSMQQLDETEQVGIYLDSNNHYVAITAERQKFTMINAPRDPIGLSKALGIDSQVNVGTKGDVRLQFQNNNRNDTFIHVIAIFDPFIEPAPQTFCGFQFGQWVCDWNAMASHQQPGFHFPANDRQRQQARVVYDDGSAQTVYATVAKPDTFIETALNFEGVSDISYQADGSFNVVYQGDNLKLYPQFNPIISEVEKGMRVKPSIELNPDGSLAYSVQDKQQLIQSRLSISIEH